MKKLILLTGMLSFLTVNPLWARETYLPTPKELFWHHTEKRWMGYTKGQYEILLKDELRNAQTSQDRPLELTGIEIEPALSVSYTTRHDISIRLVNDKNSRLPRGCSIDRKHRNQINCPN